MKPQLLKIKQIVSSEGNGILNSLEEFEKLPFIVKRLYWINDVQHDAIRGEHAHIEGEQMIVCMSGEVLVSIENIKGEKFSFSLKENNTLYIPAKCWKKFEMKKNTVLISLASTVYSESDYIRDYQVFLALVNNEKKK